MTYNPVRPSAARRGARFTSHLTLAALFCALASALPAQSVPVRLTTHPSRDFSPVWRPDGAKILFSSNRNNPRPQAADIWQMNPDGSGQEELVHVNITSPPDWGDPGLFGRKVFLGSASQLAVIEAQVFHEFMRLRLDAPRYPIVRTVQDGNDAFFTRLLFVPGGLNVSSFDYSPATGAMAYFTFLGGSRNQLRIGQLSLMSGQPTDTFGRALLDTARPGGMSFSPDGRLLVVSACDGSCNGTDLFLLDSSSGAIQLRLTSTGREGRSNWEPAWSPDGAWIAFTSNAQANDDIWLVRPDGSSLTRLTTGPMAHAGPAWSPDGSRLAFAAAGDGNTDVYVATPAPAIQPAIEVSATPDWRELQAGDAARFTVSVRSVGGLRGQASVALASLDGLGLPRPAVILPPQAPVDPDREARFVVIMPTAPDTPERVFTPVLRVSAAGAAADVPLPAWVRPADSTKLPQSGVTVISHGFTLGGKVNQDSWLVAMGAAILSRARAGALWMFDAVHDTLADITPSSLRDSSDGSFYYSGEPDSDFGEQVILVNWAELADLGDARAGSAEAVGHALYSLLLGGAAGTAAPPFGENRSHRRGFLDPADPAPLHFIGHSFGTVVNSEAIRRLGLLGIPVEQMTTLDPHDWDQPCLAVDGRALFPDVRLWANVLYADNYYNTGGGNSCDNPFGRPITGTLVGPGFDGGLDLTMFNGFHDGYFHNPHARVHAYYHGTIDTASRGSTIDGLEIDASWYPVGFDTPTGFLYSRIGGRKNRDHFSSACRIDLANPVSSLACASQRANSAYESLPPGAGDIYADVPPKPFFNGGFSFQQWDGEAYRDQFRPNLLQLYPGYQGAPIVGMRRWSDGVERPAALLNISQTALASHLTWIPVDGSGASLAFDISWDSAAAGSQLAVWFDGQPAGDAVALRGSGTGIARVDLSAFRGRSGIVEFRAERFGTTSSLWLSRIRLE